MNLANNFFLISQILAAFALLLDLGSFQFKERRSILTCLFISCCLHGAHFLLLERHTPAVLCFVAACRIVVAYYSTDKRFIYLFLSLVTLTAIFTYDGFLTILAVLGSGISTIATFQAKDKKLRQIKAIATIFWIIHNSLVPTPMGVVIEAAFLMSNLFGYYRFYGNRGPKFLR